MGESKRILFALKSWQGKTGPDYPHKNLATNKILEHYLTYFYFYVTLGRLSKDYRSEMMVGLGLWCLTPLSKIFQLYRGGHYYLWRKPSTCRKSLTNFIA